MTTVLNQRDVVYIGRGSPFGNPFKIGPDMTREQAIQAYSAYLRKRPDLVDMVRTLKGKYLVCYCAPLDCHGDILAAVAEGLLFNDVSQKSEGGK